MIFRAPPAANATAGTQAEGSWVFLPANEMTIHRTTFIVTITFCVLITGLSVLGLVAVAIRTRARRRQKEAAKRWGRKSTFNARISLMRKEIDDSYSRRYKGCLVTQFENPEMGSDSPIELMLPERTWEAPAVPAKTLVPPRDETRGKRQSNVKSLFFDHAIGLWISRK